MTWQIQFMVVCLIVAGVAALFWLLKRDDAQGSRAKTVTLAALAAGERLVDEAHAVTGERLDLDDVRAEVADDHRSERPGQVLAEVDEGGALERVHCAPAPVNDAMSLAE